MTDCFLGSVRVCRETLETGIIGITGAIVRIRNNCPVVQTAVRTGIRGKVALTIFRDGFGSHPQAFMVAIHRTD